jgi:nickel-dependent lactate racemase
MKSEQYISDNNSILDKDKVSVIIDNYIDSIDFPLNKILILPPDLTRMHSGVGFITGIIYNKLKNKTKIDILPALGTHDPMASAELIDMFGDDIPLDTFIPHNWKTDIKSCGTVPSEYIKEVSEGSLSYEIEAEINKLILDKSYDLVISVGQVVPHEVVGMANYSKNIFVGCGGKDIINKSHMLGAVYGMERLMGKDHSAVRKVFDYAETNFLKDIPLLYILTVTTANKNDINYKGLFIGRERKIFEEAVKLSQKKNLILLDREPNKVVVFLDEKEFKSTWLGNKAIYRTRMAIADGGELIILAPGVKKFGEDSEIDRLIRKYGYTGRDKILACYKESDELKENLSAAAHLIHGSSDERFNITYATKNITKEDIEGVNFKYMPLDEALLKYNPEKLKEGFNTLDDGEEVFYISNPALGLWAFKDKFTEDC